MAHSRDETDKDYPRLRRPVFGVLYSMGVVWVVWNYVEWCGVIWYGVGSVDVVL